MADVLIPLAVKLLWDESKPLRNLIYSRLPFARDATKRKFAEEELGKLLEDTHKLAKSLSPEQADESIDKRIVLFRQDLIRGQIPPDQAETLVARGEMFVRMLVTEPILEVSLLKARLTELEKAVETAESQIAELEKKVANPVKDPQMIALWMGFGVLLLLEVVQLLVSLTHQSGGISH